MWRPHDTHLPLGDPLCPQLQALGHSLTAAGSADVGHRGAWGHTNEK